MNLVLNNLERLICHKTQPTNQPNKQTTKNKDRIEMYLTQQN